MADLSLSVRRDVDLDVTVVDAHGVLGVSTMAIMRDTLMTCLAECPSSLVVDMTQCSIMNLANLSVVHAAAGRQLSHPFVDVLLVDSRRRLVGKAAALDPVTAYTDLDGALAAAAVMRSSASRVRWGLRRSLAAPGKARDAVGAACARWGIGHLARSAQLVVSELVTNAVVHAGTDIDLEVTLRGDFLHVRVRDGCATPPILRPTGSHAGAKTELVDHGRGLPIVCGLCANWGFVVNDAGDGKIVWASLRHRPAASAAHPGRGLSRVPLDDERTALVADPGWSVGEHVGAQEGETP